MARLCCSTCGAGSRFTVCGAAADAPVRAAPCTLLRLPRGIGLVGQRTQRKRRRTSAPPPTAARCCPAARVRRQPGAELAPALPTFRRGPAADACLRPAPFPDFSHCSGMPFASIDLPFPLDRGWTRHPAPGSVAMPATVGDLISPPCPSRSPCPNASSASPKSHRGAVRASGQQHRIVGISGFCAPRAGPGRGKPRVSAFTSAGLDRILALQARPFGDRLLRHAVPTSQAKADQDRRRGLDQQPPLGQKASLDHDAAPGRTGRRHAPGRAYAQQLRLRVDAVRAPCRAAAAARASISRNGTSRRSAPSAGSASWWASPAATTSSCAGRSRPGT